jgi:hypothetical protein
MNGSCSSKIKHIFARNLVGNIICLLLISLESFNWRKSRAWEDGPCSMNSDTALLDPHCPPTPCAHVFEQVLPPARSGGIPAVVKSECSYALLGMSYLYTLEKPGLFGIPKQPFNTHKAVTVQEKSGWMASLSIYVNKHNFWTLCSNDN